MGRDFCNENGYCTGINGYDNLLSRWCCRLRKFFTLITRQKTASTREDSTGRLIIQMSRRFLTIHQQTTKTFWVYTFKSVKLSTRNLVIKRFLRKRERFRKSLNSLNFDNLKRNFASRHSLEIWTNYPNDQVDMTLRGSLRLLTTPKEICFSHLTSQLKNATHRSANCREV